MNATFFVGVKAGQNMRKVTSLKCIYVVFQVFCSREQGVWNIFPYSRTDLLVESVSHEVPLLKN